MTLGEDFSNFCDINAMHTSMTKDIQWGNVRRLPNFGDSLLSQLPGHAYYILGIINLLAG